MSPWPPRKEPPERVGHVQRTTRLNRTNAVTPVVLAAFVVLTSLLTYPAILHFADAIPGDGFDGWQNYWNLWWMKVALLEEQTQPFFTDLLFHPTGVSLLFHTLNPFNGLASLGIQLSFGLLPAYNFIVFFSFVFGGFGAYLLTRHVLGPRSHPIAAFIGGAAYTFAPFHFAHLLGHMQVISLEWIPFYALYLIRALECAGSTREGTRDRRRLLREGSLAGLFLVLVGLCDWYYVMYCAFFSVLAVAVWASRGRRKRTERSSGPNTASRIVAPPARSWRRAVDTILAAMMPWAIFAVALGPLLVTMVLEASRMRFMVPDATQSRSLSADLLAFVTPQEFHPLWGEWAQAAASAFTATVSEHQVFLGFSVLALMVIALVAGILSRRNRTALPGRSLGFWLLALLAFFIMALGPVLHIGGRTQLLPGLRELHLPYGWLVSVVPFMDISRSVSRFDVMVMLSAGVLAGAGAQRLIAWKPRAGLLAAVMALALVLFEYLPAPYPISFPDTPDWYATLAASDQPGAVLNLPMNWDRPGYLLYQTVHHRPLTVAYISRDDPRTLTERVPVLQQLRHLGDDIVTVDLAAQGTQILRDLGVKWVVLDRYKMPGATERDYNEAVAGAIFGSQEPEHEDERLTVYRVPDGVGTQPYVTLGAGWGAFAADPPRRSITGSAVLTVQSPVACRAVLRIVTAPGGAPLDLPRIDDSYVLEVDLKPGANDLTIRTMDLDADAMVLSVAIQSKVAE